MEIFDRSADLYQGEHGTNPHQTATVEQVGERLPAGARVLDLGCGTGALGMVDFDGDSVPVEFLGVPVTVSGYPEPQLRQRLEAAGLGVESIRTVEYRPENGPAESQIFAITRRS